MNNNVNWHCFLLTLGLILAIPTVGYCQERPQKIEFGSSVGVLSFDDELSFGASPAFGLDAGYNFKQFLQLNLELIYTPAQQKISAAASKIATNISVYQYILNLKFRKQTPILWWIKPFVNIGAGGILFDPQSSSSDSLDVGGGLMIPLDFATDHKFIVNFGGGFAIPLSRMLLLNLEYRKYFYRLNLNDGIEAKTATANNNYWGARLSVRLAR